VPSPGILQSYITSLCIKGPHLTRSLPKTHQGGDSGSKTLRNKEKARRTCWLSLAKPPVTPLYISSSAS
jgi:hypothetical protein